jgi:hypothetical protein
MYASSSLEPLPPPPQCPYTVSRTDSLPFGRCCTSISESSGCQCCVRSQPQGAQGMGTNGKVDVGARRHDECFAPDALQRVRVRCGGCCSARFARRTANVAVLPLFDIPHKSGVPRPPRNEDGPSRRGPAGRTRPTPRYSTCGP